MTAEAMSEGIKRLESNRPMTPSEVVATMQPLRPALVNSPAAFTSPACAFTDTERESGISRGYKQGSPATLPRLFRRNYKHLCNQLSFHPTRRVGIRRTPRNNIIRLPAIRVWICWIVRICRIGLGRHFHDRRATIRAEVSPARREISAPRTVKSLIVKLIIVISGNVHHSPFDVM